MIQIKLVQINLLKVSHKKLRPTKSNLHAVSSTNEHIEHVFIYSKIVCLRPTQDPDHHLE